MLQQFFHIILISIICILWGLTIIAPIGKVNDHIWYRSRLSVLSSLFFNGCLLISFASSWLCFITPLQYHYLAIISLLPILYIIFYQQNKITQLYKHFNLLKTKFTFLQVLFLITCISLFIILSTLIPSHLDTQFYHLQVIRWQNEYGIVPGLANLYPRLGLGSNWFNIISLFYIPIFKSDNFNFINVTFVCWFFIWLYSNWSFHYQKFTEKKEHKILAVFYFSIIIFGLFDWQFFRDGANSTNYDFVVNAFIIFIFSYFLEAVLLKKNQFLFSPLIIFYSFSIISLKFSGIFISLLVLYHLITSNGGKFKWLFTISIGFVILLPVFIKNYITTGYPLYPYPLTINQPDWIFPKEMADRFYNYIILTNRYYNYDWSFIQELNHTTLNWIPFWFKGILIQHKLIGILALLLSIYLFIKIDDIKTHKQLRPLIFILLIMIGGWFFTAPDPGRFGYGVLLTAAFLFSSLFLYPIINKAIFNPILILLIICVSFYTYKKSPPHSRNPKYLLAPISTYKPTYKIININGLKYNLPEKVNINWDHRCFYTPLPCITQMNPYLQLRGKNIKDGFMIFPYPDSNFIRNYQY